MLLKFASFTSNLAAFLFASSIAAAVPLEERHGSRQYGLLAELLKHEPEAVQFCRALLPKYKPCSVKTTTAALPGGHTVFKTKTLTSVVKVTSSTTTTVERKTTQTASVTDLETTLGPTTTINAAARREMVELESRHRHVSSLRALSKKGAAQQACKCLLDAVPACTKTKTVRTKPKTQTSTVKATLVTKSTTLVVKTMTQIQTIKETKTVATSTITLPGPTVTAPAAPAQLCNAHNRNSISGPRSPIGSLTRYAGDISTQECLALCDNNSGCTSVGLLYQDYCPEEPCTFISTCYLFDFSASEHPLANDDGQTTLDGQRYRNTVSDRTCPRVTDE